MADIGALSCFVLCAMVAEASGDAKRERWGVLVSKVSPRLRFEPASYLDPFGTEQIVECHMDDIFRSANIGDFPALR